MMIILSFDEQYKMIVNSENIQKKMDLEAVCFCCDHLSLLTPRLYPTVSVQSDSIKLVLRNLCGKCCSSLRNIEYYCEHTAPTYCNYSFKEVSNLKPATAIQFQSQCCSLYQQFLLQQIQSKKLYSFVSLPKPLLYMIWLSKYELRPVEERQRKVRRLLQFMIHSCAVSVEELPHAVIVIQVLLCHMDAHFALLVLNAIKDKCTLDWKQLANAESLERVWGKISEIVHSKGGQGIAIQGKRERNNLQLILRAVQADSESVRDIMQRNQKKYQGEKEEFVKTIVKLKNKIKSLEDQIKKYCPENQRNTKQSQGQKMSKGLEKQFQECSEQQQKQYKKQQKQQKQQYKQQKQQKQQQKQQKQQKQQQNKQQQKQQKQKQYKQQQKQSQCKEQCVYNKDDGNTKECNEVRCKCIELLISQTGILKNRSVKEKEAREVWHGLIEEIKQLMLKPTVYRKQLQDVKGENVKLLHINDRQQDSLNERIMTVMKEKDAVINRYEGALWRLENGLEVVDQSLAERISYISAKRYRDKKQSKCNIY